MSLEFTMTKKDERILMKLYSMYEVCLCKSLVLYYNIAVIYYNILYMACSTNLSSEPSQKAIFSDLSNRFYLLPTYCQCIHVYVEEFGYTNLKDFLSYQPQNIETSYTDVSESGYIPLIN